MKTPRRETHDAGTEPVFGLRAGLAVFAVRRDDVVRAVFARDRRSEVKALLEWAASRGVSCVELPERELDRLAASSHHEGLIVFARPRRFEHTSELVDGLVRGRGAAVALDRVRNPYNVGAIVRTAAFFGLDAVLLGAQAPHPALAPLAVRVAEGGAERIAIARTTDLADTLERMRRRGVAVVGTDADAERRVPPFTLPRPTVLVFGNERDGLDRRVRLACDHMVAVGAPIRGAARGDASGRARPIDSLNVAVAAGVLMSHLVGGEAPTTA